MNPIKTTLTHEQVFDHLKHESFTTEEAAQYLEVSIPTFRRYVQSGKLKPSQVVGRSQLFATSDLRRLKQKLS
jgi:excisionase family DNA binding protein